MLTRAQAKNAEDGFTLVELLIVMVIMGVIGTMVLTSFVSSARSSTTATRQLDAINDLTPAMQRMTRDLRAAAPLLIDDEGDYESEVGTEFERGGTTYRTHYRLDVSEGGTTRLMQTRREVGDSEAPSTAMVAEVDNDLSTQPVFTYYDADGEPITCADATPACRDEHLTAARLEILVLRGIEDADAIEYRTSVNIRNARFGS